MRLNKESAMDLDRSFQYRGLVNVEEFIPRAITQGLHYTDTVQTLRRITDDESWWREWCRTAEAHKAQASKALLENRKTTAGQAFFRAALCYHFGQFLYFRDIEAKQKTAGKAAACYRDGMAYFLPPAQLVEIPFENITLAGFLRMPPGRGKSPCVLFINGTDGTKLEFHNIEDQFLLRGIATLSFDGPGQGETRVKMNLRPDFEKATSAVLNFMSQVPGIDPDRMGVLGMSFGGHLAVRSACCDERLKACIMVGGFYETSYYNWEDPLRRIRFQHLCGTTDIGEAKRVAAGFNLSGLIDKMKSALLVVHGRLDKTTPLVQAERVHAEARGPKRLEIFDEGDHCCHNIPYRTHPLISDWAADVLGT
jgi:2,6-dihydroxypseudooxynicotine hydrolase